MKAAERLARIHDIREKAVKIISKHGVLGPFGSSASVGALRISLRTPFQKLPTVLPYGLDIWDEHRKVLNVEWDEAGAVDVVSYKPGEWEFLLGPSC